MQVGGSKIRASEDVRRYFEKHKGLNSAKHLLSIDGAENKKYLSTFKVQFIQMFLYVIFVNII